MWELSAISDPDPLGFLVLLRVRYFELVVSPRLPARLRPVQLANRMRGGENIWHLALREEKGEMLGTDTSAI